MKPSREQIESDLQVYVNSALMPCPFAKLPTAYVHLEDMPGTSRVQEQLKTALDTFYPYPSVSILALVPPSEPETHGKARRQAFLLLQDWMNLHAEAVFSDEAKRATAKRLVATRIQEMINDSELYIGPHFEVGDRHLIGTTFNPLYPPYHSRYAPHTVYTTIRMKDLSDISERKPELSKKISEHSKSKILFSMITNREGVTVDDILKEIELWNRHLFLYNRFVMELDVPSYRLDEETRPVMKEIRGIRKQALPTVIGLAPKAKAHLKTCGQTPTLCKILDQNPELSLLEIARVVYGDTSGHYVIPQK
ncbi:MAG: hypothetical protein AAB383_03140 [Patescibacteria group bacterium]